MWLGPVTDYRGKVRSSDQDALISFLRARGRRTRYPVAIFADSGETGAQTRRSPGLSGSEDLKHLLLAGVFCLCALGSTLPATGRRLGVDYDFGVRLPAAAAETGFRSTFAETVPVLVRTGVATEDDLKGLLKEMQGTAEDVRVLIAQACLPGVAAIK
jgi:hypothetical protein